MPDNKITIIDVDPSRVTDIVTDGLALIEAAEWTPDDRLRAHPWGLVQDCECGCGASSAITARLNPNAARVAELAAWATTNLAAALAEIVALRDDLAAKNSDFEGACRRLQTADIRAAGLLAALNREPDRASKLADIRALATEWAERGTACGCGRSQEAADGRAVLAIVDRDAIGAE